MEDRSFKISARQFFIDNKLEDIINEEFSNLIEENDTYEYMDRDKRFSLEK